MGILNCFHFCVIFIAKNIYVSYLKKSFNLILKVVIDCLRQTNNVSWDFAMCGSTMFDNSSTKAGRGKRKASGVPPAPERMQTEAS